jgi:hypothetical protein
MRLTASRWLSLKLNSDLIDGSYWPAQEEANQSTVEAKRSTPSIPGASRSRIV